MALRLDGYIRVPRIGGRQGEGYIAPDVQRDGIESYAHDLDGEVVVWHDDQDYSVGNLDRPGFEAALERIRAGESDGIVVMAVDRFARSVPDGSAIVREIVDERGAVFASCQERIDPRTPDGRYMLHMFLSNAQLFLDRIKSGWWTAKARAVARGAHIGPTPIGYRRIPNGEPDSGKLLPDPHYGPAITELFARATTGEHGDTALARWMTERAARKSGAPWQPSEIRRWLSNRVYLGEVHYGNSIEPNLSAHQELTDPETWERCQRKPGTQRRAHSRFLLSGLLRCASCRYSMGGFSYGGAKHDTPVYRCARGRNGGCAESSVIVAERIESYLIEVITERLEGLKVEAAAEGIDLAMLDREADESEAELRAFAADVNARRLLGEADWRQALAARAADRDAKRQRRDDAYSRSHLVNVARDVDDLDHDALRDLFHGMVRCAFVRRRPRGADAADRVLAVWSDDPRQIDLPGPHRPGPFEPVRW